MYTELEIQFYESLAQIALYTAAWADYDDDANEHCNTAINTLQEIYHDIGAWSGVAEDVSYEDLLTRLMSLKEAIHKLDFPVESNLSPINSDELISMAGTDAGNRIYDVETALKYVLSALDCEKFAPHFLSTVKKANYTPDEIDPKILRGVAQQCGLELP